MGADRSSANTLFAGSIVFIVLQIVTKLGMFFLLPVYTSLLDPVQYGKMTFALSSAQFAATLLSAPFYSAQSRYVAADDQSSPKIVFSVLVLYSVVCLVFLLVSWLWLGEYVFRWAGIAVGPDVILATALLSVLMGYTYIVAQFYSASREYLASASSTALVFLVGSSASVSLMLYLGGSPKMYLYGQVIGVFLVLMYYLPKYSSFAVFSLERACIDAVLRYGSPILFHIAGTLTLSSGARLIVSRNLSEAEVGFFGLGMQLAMSVMILLTAFNEAWYPVFIGCLDSKCEISRSTERRSFFCSHYLALVSSFLVVVFVGDVIELFLDPEYQSATAIAQIMAITYGFYSIYYYYSTVFLYFGRNIDLAAISLFAGLCAVILSFFLTQSFGLIGGAVGISVSVILQTVLVYFVSEKMYSSPVRISKYLASFMIMAIVSFVVIYSSLGFMQKVAVFFLFLFSSYIYFAKEIDDVASIYFGLGRGENVSRF